MTSVDLSGKPKKNHSALRKIVADVPATKRQYLIVLILSSERLLAKRRRRVMADMSPIFVSTKPTTGPTSPGCGRSVGHASPMSKSPMSKGETSLHRVPNASHDTHTTVIVRCTIGRPCQRFCGYRP